MKNIIAQHLDAHQRTVEGLRACASDIIAAAETCIKALAEGNTIFLCGNGGSAADAQHIAAELVGRFVNDRRSLPGLALTTDTSALTAIANDYGYDHVFSRQVDGLAKRGDVLIGISTSGNSPNIFKACEAARAKGCAVIALSGRSGGLLKESADVSIVVADEETARIQECHILVGHILCDLIETALALK